MSNLMNELTEKRRGSQNDEPSNKHVKSDSIEPMNMMDLNDDCLDHILKKLNQMDLLNVADTSKRLMQAAQSAFKSKYRKIVWALGVNWYDETRISVSRFVTFLKIIRCFGKSISKLKLFYDGMSERQCVELDRYLKEYCVSFVTELTVSANFRTKQISKIESFTFFPDIKTFMPNLLALTLIHCNSIECITAYFTQFSQSENLETRVEKNEQWNLASLKTCLRLNPQLKSLEIRHFHVDLQLLRIASECAQLKSLKLFGGYEYFGTNTGAEPIQFRNVTKFGTSGHFFDAMVSSKALISFDQLDELDIRDGRGKESLIRFLNEYPSISKFYYSGHWSYNEKISSEMLRELPSVTEAVFSWICSVDVAIKFVNERKLLKKFVFKLAERSEYDVLQKLLGKEWRSFIDRSNRVTLEC